MVLGLALRDRFYPTVNYKDLKLYLKYHDVAKTDYIHGNLHTSVADLYNYYGIWLEDEEHKQELKRLVDQINHIDKKIAVMFLDAFRVAPENIGLFKKIERIADIVDRGMDPVASEEFGRPLKKASEFSVDEESKAMILWLERHYYRITENFRYESGSNRCKGALEI